MHGERQTLKEMYIYTFISLFAALVLNVTVQKQFNNQGEIKLVVYPEE